MSAIAVPQSLAAVDRARALSAARFLASRMAVARSQAVMRSTHVALQFEDRPSGITFRMFVDGNRNGVRTNDISAGIDAPVEATVRLREPHQWSAIAVSARQSDPVRLARAIAVIHALARPLMLVFVRGRDGSQVAVACWPTAAPGAAVCATFSGGSRPLLEAHARRLVEPSCSRVVRSPSHPPRRMDNSNRRISGGFASLTASGSAGIRLGYGPS